MTSKLGMQTFSIHIFTNISRSKWNQATKFGLLIVAMKFDQLIEHSMRNIFLEKSYTSLTEKLFPDPFLKNRIWAYIWINILKFYIFYSYCLPSWGLSKVIETKFQTTCFYLKAFLKNKKRSGTSLHTSQSVWYLKKNISMVILYYLTKFQCLVAFTSWYIGLYV